MSRERKRRRESLKATLERYEREQHDPAHEARYQAWLKGWLGDAYRPPTPANRSPLAMADAEEQIAREMRDVERYNRTHRSA